MYTDDHTQVWVLNEDLLKWKKALVVEEALSPFEKIREGFYGKEG